MKKLTTKITWWEEIQAWTAVFLPFLLGWLVSGWLVLPALILGGIWFLSLMTRAKQSKRRQLIEAMICAWDHPSVLSRLAQAYQDDPTEPHWKPIQLLLSQVWDHHVETEHPAGVFGELVAWRKYAAYLKTCANSGVPVPVEFEAFVKNNATVEKARQCVDSTLAQRQEVDDFLDAAGPQPK